MFTQTHYSSEAKTRPVVKKNSGKAVKKFKSTFSEDLRSQDQLSITFYTDPLCCWSKALESHIQRIKDDMPGLVNISYCMCGMITNLKSKAISTETVKKPAQIRSVWKKVRDETGLSVNDKVWHNDPPISSYPGALAVKTAGLQSGHAEEKMIQELRKAVVLYGRNISRTDVLEDIVNKVADSEPDFDIKRFKKDYNSPKSRKALNSDLKEAQSCVDCFPALTLSKEGYESVKIFGYKPYEEIAESLKAMF